MNFIKQIYKKWQRREQTKRTKKAIEIFIKSEKSILFGQPNTGRTHASKTLGETILKNKIS